MKLIVNSLLNNHINNTNEIISNSNKLRAQKVSTHLKIDSGVIWYIIHSNNRDTLVCIFVFCSSIFSKNV